MGFGGNVAIALRREPLQATDVCFPRRLTSLADLPLRQKSGPTERHLTSQIGRLAGGRCAQVMDCAGCPTFKQLNRRSDG